MVKIVWTNHAYLDLKDIFDYIAKDSQRYAFFQVNRIKESTKSLKEFPKSGRIVPEIGNEDIRELIEGNYRIIYRLKNSERIDILTVYSSYRILKIDKII